LRSEEDLEVVIDEGVSPFWNPRPWLDLHNAIEGGIAISLLELTNGAADRRGPFWREKGKTLLMRRFLHQSDQMEHDPLSRPLEFQIVQAMLNDLDDPFGASRFPEAQ
jgi:hypothetical protein